MENSRIDHEGLGLDKERLENKLDDESAGDDEIKDPGEGNSDQRAEEKADKTTENEGLD